MLAVALSMIVILLLAGAVLLAVSRPHRAETRGDGERSEPRSAAGSVSDGDRRRRSHPVPGGPGQPLTPRGPGRLVTAALPTSVWMMPRG